MPDDITSIGERLKRVRREHAMTQEDLAEASGVSRDLIAKLEQGRRQTARISSLGALADALDVELSDLLGKRPRLDHGGDGPSVLAVRDALTAMDHLPGIDPAGDDGEATPLDELRATVEAGWARYWRGDFNGLAAIVPGIIGEARVSRRAAGPEAAGMLAQAYQLAACLMVQVGRDDIALIGAERAVRAAADGDDLYQWATVHGTYSWALLHQGRLDEAEQLAARVAQRIEPSFSDPEPAIAAWGNMLMTALAPCAAAGRDISEYVSMGAAAGERVGHRVDVYETAFGPTSAAMQAVHAWSVRGEPGKALDAVKRVDREDLRGISYGAHLLDVGRAHLDARHPKAAIATLQEAQQHAPVWFRHQGIARSVIAELVETEKRLTPPLRSLAHAVGVN